MQLRIQQRIFSWSDSYDVFDESGDALYEVKADLFSLTHRIRVYDKHTGQEVGRITQKLLSLLPAFSVTLDGKDLGWIRRKPTLLRQDYALDYLNWEVAGNFIGWEYRVVQCDREILSISKEYWKWTDTYTLTFRNPADALPGLLLVLAIDAANRCFDE